MVNPIKTITDAGKIVFQNKRDVKIFLISSVLLLAILILLPVFTVPGNNITAQLRVLTPLNYVLMVFLSSSMGLMISMQLYRNKTKRSMREAGSGVVGGFSGVIAGIFGTAACSSCVAAIFGFLGFGTVLFLLEYQNYVVGVSILLIYLSIFLTSKNILKGCNVCK